MRSRVPAAGVRAMTASRVGWITDRSVHLVWTMASGTRNTGPNGPGPGGPDTMWGYFQHRRATLRTLLTSEGPLVRARLRPPASPQRRSQHHCGAVRFMDRTALVGVAALAAADVEA